MGSWRRSRILLLGTAVALSLVAAQAPTPRPPFPGGDHPGARADWFMRFRQSRDGISPAAHRYRAWRQARRMPVIRPRRQLSAAAAALAGSAAPPTLGGNWTELGPRPETTQQFGAVGGRMISIAVDLGADSSGNTVYLGAADGGLWMSPNAQSPQPTFTPIGDNLPSLAIGAIALDSSTSPTTIYVGTGEGNSSQDSYYGVGILKSTDGGKNWTPGTGVDFLGSAVTRLLVDPASPNILLASVTESGVFVGDNFTNTAAAIGIVRSVDGGATWTHVYNNNASATDLVYDPISHDYFAAIRAHGIVVSADQGQTWQPVSGNPLGGPTITAKNFSRVSLAQRSGVLYALMSDSAGDPTQASDCGGATSCTGLAESADDGQSWIALAPPANLFNHQGFFDQDIAAPAGTNLLVVGGIDEWKENLAAPRPAWTDMTNSYGSGTVHMDEHAILCLDPERWYIANDGGAWFTADAGASWSNLNASIGVIQFYSVTPDPATAGRLLGGSQDNGTSLATPGTQAWSEIVAGDGGHTAINPANPQQLFIENTGVSLRRSDDGGTAFQTVVDSSTISDAGGFYIPYVLTTDAATAFLATQRVWRGPATATAGSGWIAISPNLTHPDGNMDPNGDDLTVIAVAPSSPDTVYVGAFDGSLSATTNATNTQGLPTWTSPFQEPIFAGPVSAIAVSPADPKTVYWGMGFIGTTAVLFKSIDGGVTRSDIAGDLPGSPINAIVVDPANPNAIYVATDVGVFAAGDGGAGGANEHWARVGDKLPAAAVLSLALTSAGGTPTLIAGTHGRGAWSLPAVAPASFTVAVSPTALTAEVGHTATAAVQVTPVGGASTVGLSCSPSCAVSPASVAGGGATLTWTAPSTSGTTNLQLTADNGFTAVTQSIAATALDFSFQVGGSLAGAVEAGQSISVPYSVVSGLAPGFDAPIALSCPNAPAGVSCVFSPASPIASLGQRVDGTLQIQAAPSAAPGPVTLDVRASGGLLTRDASFHLNVNQFTLAATPALQPAVVSTPATFTVSASSATGFTAAIALACTADFGAQGTCSFQPASIQAGQTSTASITGFAVGGFQPSPSVYTLTGTSGASVSSAQVSVQPQDFFLNLNGPFTTLPGSDGMTRTTMIGQAFGYSTPVALSCSSPAGVSCTFNPPILAPGQSGTVRFSGMAGLAVSSAIPLTVIGTATSGTLVHTVPLNLRNDADVVFADTTINVPTLLSGDPATFNVFYRGTNNYVGTMTIACAPGIPFPCSIVQSGAQATVVPVGNAPGSVNVPFVVSATEGGATVAKTFQSTLKLGDFSVAASPSTARLFPGTSAALGLTLAATPGMNQGIAITCAGLPANVTCDALPTNLAAGAGTLTVHEAATAGAGAFGGGGWGLGLLLLGGSCLLGLGRQRPRLALVGLMALASVACGGGGGAPQLSGGANPPPTVTTTVTITATDATPGVADPVSHATTVQLTVN
ncbi:MAG TPA: sialidase family protein [Terriglobales bacterium]|nr:sialidase family protein [Terriglobales bacterium]